MEEEWKEIPDWSDYEVSSQGRVRRTTKARGGPRLGSNRIRTLVTDRVGYQQITFCRNGRWFIFRVHQLVALAFIGPRPEGKEVNHKDGNKKNNTPPNLEYVTRSENVLHSYTKLGNKAARGERCSGAKVTEAQAKKALAAIRAGAHIQTVSRRLGMNQTWGYDLLNGKIWKHLQSGS